MRMLKAIFIVISIILSACIPGRNTSHPLKQMHFFKNNKSFISEFYVQEEVFEFPLSVSSYWIFSPIIPVYTIITRNIHS
jgi:hypothetical protein